MELTVAEERRERLKLKQCLQNRTLNSHVIWLKQKTGRNQKLLENVTVVLTGNLIIPALA